MPLDDTSRNNTKVQRDAFLYEDPRKPDGQFAQCGTCRLFLPRREFCAIIGIRVAAEDSCGLYVHGEPTDDQRVGRDVTAKEAGFVKRQVRCENCKFFKDGHICGLYENLNKTLPQIFELDTEVDKFGCCNAQTPGSGHASGGRVRMQYGGDPDALDTTGGGLLAPGLLGPGLSQPGLDPLRQALTQAYPGAGGTPGDNEALRQNIIGRLTSGLTGLGGQAAPAAPRPPTALTEPAPPADIAEKTSPTLAAPGVPSTPSPTFRPDLPTATATPQPRFTLRVDPKTGQPFPGQQIPADVQRDIAHNQLFGQSDTHPSDQPGIIGAGLRSAVRGLIPGGTGALGFGAGARAGAAVGSLFGPEGTFIGGVIGGLAGGWLGGAAGDEVQDKALDALPEGVKDAVGMSEKQRAADYAAHPYISELGGIASQLAFMRPESAAEAAFRKAVPLRPGASAFEKMLHTHPHITSAALMAGTEAGKRAIDGQTFDPVSIGMDALSGAFLSQPTALGRKLTAYGYAPFNKTLRGAIASPPPAPTTGSNPAYPNAPIFPPPGYAPFPTPPAGGAPPPAGGPLGFTPPLGVPPGWTPPPQGPIAGPGAPAAGPGGAPLAYPPGGPSPAWAAGGPRGGLAGVSPVFPSGFPPGGGPAPLPPPPPTFGPSPIATRMAATAPVPFPPIGSVVSLHMPGGLRTATVTGHSYTAPGLATLTFDDGHFETMPISEVQRLQVAMPPGSPAASGPATVAEPQSASIDARLEAGRRQQGITYDHGEQPEGLAYAPLSPAETLPAAIPQPAGFKTEQGSSYQINDQGQTLRTKRSPGPGQGIEYEPHNVLYVDQNTAQDLLTGSPSRQQLRLGYELPPPPRPARRRREPEPAEEEPTVRLFGEAPGAVPEGATPVVVKAAADPRARPREFLSAAQVTPQVGLVPVETRYANGRLYTHVGHPITEIYPRPGGEAAAVPPREPVLPDQRLEEIRNRLLGTVGEQGEMTEETAQALEAEAERKRIPEVPDEPIDDLLSRTVAATPTQEKAAAEQVRAEAHAEARRRLEQQAQQEADADNHPPSKVPNVPELLEVDAGKDSRGNPVWRVPLSDDLANLSSEARPLGGRYYGRAGNVVFRNQEAAEKFAVRVRQVMEMRLQRQRQLGRAPDTDPERAEPTVTPTPTSDPDAAPAPGIQVEFARVGLDPLVTAQPHPKTGKQIYSVEVPYARGTPFYDQLAETARRVMKGKWNANLKAFVFDDPTRANLFAQRVRSQQEPHRVTTEAPPAEPAPEAPAPRRGRPAIAPGTTPTQTTDRAGRDVWAVRYQDSPNFPDAAVTAVRSGASVDTFNSQFVFDTQEEANTFLDNLRRGIVPERPAEAPTLPPAAPPTPGLVRGAPPAAPPEAAAPGPGEPPPLHPDVVAFSDPATGENRWAVPSPIDRNHPDFAYWRRQAENADGVFSDGRFVFEDPDDASGFATSLAARRPQAARFIEPELDPLVGRLQHPTRGTIGYAVRVERRPDDPLYQSLARVARNAGAKYLRDHNAFVFDDATDANRFAEAAHNYFAANPQLRPRQDMGPTRFGRILNWLKGSPTTERGKLVADAQQEENPLQSLTGHQDLTDDFREWIGAGGAQPGDLGFTPADRLNFGAASWVRDRGARTNTEHSVVLSPGTGEMVAHTDGAVDHVNWPEAAREAVHDPSSRLFAYHNHPSGFPSSPGDFRMFHWPGIEWNIVVSPDGFNAMRLTPQMAKYLNPSAYGTLQHIQNNTLVKLWMNTRDKFREPLAEAVERGDITEKQAGVFALDTVHRILDAAGIVDHISSYDVNVPDIAMGGRSKAQLIRDLGHEVANEQWGRRYNPDAVEARLDRSTRVVRPDEGLAEISGDFAGIAGSARPGGPQRYLRGREGIAGPRASEAPLSESIRLGREPQVIDDGNQGPLLGEAEAQAVANQQRRDEALFGPNGSFPGLIDTRFPDASDAFTRRAINEALMRTPRREEQYPLQDLTERIGEQLGTRPGDPGYEDPHYNLANKLAMTPQALADRDPRSTPWWRAWMQRRNLMNTFRSKYVGMISSSWGRATADQIARVWRVLEVASNEQQPIPMDGRPITVTNNTSKYTAVPFGASETLTDPHEIQMAIDMRNALDATWKDLIAQTARKYNYHGSPDVYSIRQAAATAPNLRSQKQLERLIKIVSAVEYAHRTSYLPNMRFGDYYLRITPEPGTPARDGVPGGAAIGGYPRTAWFQFVDSQDSLKRYIPGMRPGTPPNIQQHIDAAFERLGIDPANRGEYKVEHGWVGDLVGARERNFANLEIPALDKLMAVTGNDMRKALQDSYQRAGMRPDDARRKARQDYETFTDAILDKVVDERVAGFRRHRNDVPGYSQDWGKAVSNYFNWTAAHNADLTTRDAIDAARVAAIERHPNTWVRQFWTDWERRQEDVNEPMFGPLNLMRQYAFHTMLGMNAATSLKFLLHGPMLGFPTITTGLSAGERMAVAGQYAGLLGRMLTGIRIGSRGLELDPMQFAQDDGERALIRDSLAKHIIEPELAQQMRGETWAGKQTLSARIPMLSKMLDISGSNITVMDRLTRTAALLTAYRLAKQPGMMQRLNDVWSYRDVPGSVKGEGSRIWSGTEDKTPEAWAQYMVQRVSGIGGDFNRNMLMRGPLGGTIFQFRGFDVNYLSTMWQLMSRMGPEGKMSAVLMLGGLGLLGGATALPFYEDASQAGTFMWNTISGILRSMGVPIGLTRNLDTELRSAMDAMLGNGWGDEVLHGGMRNLGIDLQGIGFGDLISRSTENPMEYFGASASALTGQPMRAIERYAGGQGTMAAVRELMPNVVRHLLDAYNPQPALESARSGKPYMSPDQLTPADHVKMAFGFVPAIKSQTFEGHLRNWQLSGQYHGVLDQTENQIANLIARGADPATALTTAQRIMADGARVGAFNPQTVMQQFRFDLQSKIFARMQPDIGSRTEMRERALNP